MEEQDLLNIQLSEDTKLFVVSDIHEHHEQFFELMNKFSFSDKFLLLVLGDVVHKGFGRDKAELIYDFIRKMQKAGLAYFIKGNHEVKELKRWRLLQEDTMAWLADQPVALSFIYPNGQRYTAVHAGITNKHNLTNIADDIGVCYVRFVSPDFENSISCKRIKIGENKWEWVPVKKPAVIWQPLYDGQKFGYILAGHAPNMGGDPIFYKNAVDIDTGVFKTGILAGLIVDQNKKFEVVKVEGPAFKVAEDD